jgi:hypothetical protein
MARNITIEFNPSGYSHNVFTGLTSGTTTGIVCQNVMTGCTFSINDSYVSLSGDTVWVRITCDGCKDQYYPIKLVTETCYVCGFEVGLLDCGTLSGSVENVYGFCLGYDIDTCGNACTDYSNCVA